MIRWTRVARYVAIASTALYLAGWAGAQQQNQAPSLPAPAIVPANSAPVSTASPISSPNATNTTASSAAKAAATSAAKPTSASAASAPAVRDDAAMLVEGEKRFATNCGRCHQSPHHFPPRMMATIVRHMRVRATVTDEDMRLILRYMAQ